MESSRGKERGVEIVTMRAIASQWTLRTTFGSQAIQRVLELAARTSSFSSSTTTVVCFLRRHGERLATILATESQQPLPESSILWAGPHTTLLFSDRILWV